jgi:hypothetical protein
MSDNGGPGDSVLPRCTALEEWYPWRSRAVSRAYVFVSVFVEFSLLRR